MLKSQQAVHDIPSSLKGRISFYGAHWVMLGLYWDNGK